MIAKCKSSVMVDCCGLLCGRADVRAPLHAFKPARMGQCRCVRLTLWACAHCVCVGVCDLTGDLKKRLFLLFLFIYLFSVLANRVAAAAIHTFYIAVLLAWRIGVGDVVSFISELRPGAAFGNSPAIKLSPPSLDVSRSTMKQ